MYQSAYCADGRYGGRSGGDSTGVRGYRGATDSVAAADTRWNAGAVLAIGLHRHGHHRCNESYCNADFLTHTQINSAILRAVLSHKPLKEE